MDHILCGNRSLPDPLVSGGGERIVSAEQWRQKRRPEILELFRKHVYGRAPIGRPGRLSFEETDVRDSMMDGTATRRKIDIRFEGPGGKGVIHLLLFTPNGIPKPLPAFLLICNRGADNIDPDRNEKSPFWPAEQIVARGYAAAAFQVSDADPDEDDGFKNGVHGIFDPGDEPRPPDAWGTISAWAWGASRVMDYFETNPHIDIRRVAVVGHSRGGKTALWCGAQDDRFALVISNESGCTGAAIARGTKGETVKDINKVFPHWFCGNYKKYNERESELPVDQHMLLSLIAPRPVYVASASEDIWADPESEFLSCVCAEPVYHLFGLKGLEINKMPLPEQPVHNGFIGYHLRTGKHDLTEYDWKRFMDYADRFIYTEERT
ncbi:MAG: alpha/beta hydrolase family protein [Bacillota bacterium]